MIIWLKNQRKVRYLTIQLKRRRVEARADARLLRRFDAALLGPWRGVLRFLDEDADALIAQELGAQARPAGVCSLRVSGFIISLDQ